MVNWAALIESAIGVLLLYVAIAIIDPIQIPLFGVLSNSIAFPNGDTTIVLIQLLPLVLGVMLIWSAFTAFREPPKQQFIQ